MDKVLYSMKHTKILFKMFCLSAVAQDDYAVQNGGTKRFPPCTAELCFLITTVNDELVEEDEEFYISLSSGPNWDDRVYLNQTTAKVTIIDDDCEFYSILVYEHSWSLLLYSGVFT